VNIHWKDVLDQGLPVRLHRFPGGSCYQAMTPKGEAVVYWTGKEAMDAQQVLDGLVAVSAAAAELQALMCALGGW